MRFRAYSLAAVLSACLSIAGCGGGAGNPGGLGDGVTNGFTCQNFTAPGTAASSYTGATSAASVNTGSLLSISGDLLATMLTLDNVKAVVPLPLQTQPSSETCTSSDSSTGAGSLNFVRDERPDGSGYGYEAFSGYTVTLPTSTGSQTFTLDGVEYAVFAPVATGSLQSETVSFINLHVTVQNYMDVMLNGTMTLQAPANIPLAELTGIGGQVSADMVILDTRRNNRTVWAHQLSYSDITDTTLGLGYVDRSASGTLYDASLGSISVSTVNPMVYTMFRSYISPTPGPKAESLGGGPFKFAGTGTAAGYLIPLSQTLYAIALDDAGNGNWDRSARIDAQTYELDTTPYPSLTGPVPVAAVGNAATVTQTSFPAVVDGLRSYSPAGKFVSYAWSILSRPGGSTAALTNANSAVPGFAPDLPGTYLLQLTVSDGVTSNSEDVPLKADKSISGVVLEQHHAVAGPDLQAHVGQTITVDGKASSGIDSNVWEFEWTLVPPPGSSAKLAYAKTFAMAGDQTQTSFVPDVPGFYMLVLNEGDSYGIFSVGATEIVAVDTGFDFHRPATLVDTTAHIFGFHYAVGDFNGDGIMDVAVAYLDLPTSGPAHGKVDVFYGNKQGGFSGPTTITVSNAAVNAIYAADVNNDGRTDLVVDATGVYALLQQSDGTLGSPTQIGASSACITGSSPVSLAGVGPWKSASTDSIFTVQGTCLDVYSSTSATTFASGGTETSPYATYSLGTTSQIADVTGDGISDIVGINCTVISSPALVVIPGQASGSYGSAVSYPFPNKTCASSLVVADFNHDGLLDAAALEGGTIDLFLQNGSNAFAAATHPAILTKPAGYSSFETDDLTVCDLNGDGREDLLVHHFEYPFQDPNNSNIYENPTYLGVLFQSNTGSFGSEWLYPLSLFWSPSIIPGASSMAVGDFNGDGQPDVVTLDGSGSLMVVYQKPFK